jgi:hypothetical protein
MPSASTFIVWESGNTGSPERYLFDGDTAWGLHGFARNYDFQKPLHGAEPKEWLRNIYGAGISIEPAERDAGTYYPRFYKGGFFIDLSRDDVHPDYDLEAATLSHEQADLLIEELRSICRVTTPDDATNQAYGSRIRNLLILASTEVEALMKGTLVMNGYSRTDGRHLSMTDYVKLAGPMKLSDYGLKLRIYKRYSVLRPFAGWIDNDTKPSWYQAYNAVKHDREAAMAQATLQSAIEAVAAVTIMLRAQYGEERASWMSFFQTKSVPTWAPTEATYSDPTKPDVWTPVRYKF